ncbi:hypothetical protein HYY75_12600 [bacterium]|nr:hypothetical protein [bacterium]
MSITPSLSYLKSFFFCGLCFKKMDIQNEAFFCHSGCFKGLSAVELEEILWDELGKFLSHASQRTAAAEKLKEKLSAKQIRLLFKSLKGFVGFLPVEDKERFMNSLVEKVEITSSNSINIVFRF